MSSLDGFTTTTAPIKDRVWGVYAENSGGGGTLYELTSLNLLEANVSHTFPVVSGYMDSELDSTFLANMKAIANRGGALNISYDLEWTFASILTGAHDAAINAHAASFATVNGPVYLRLWAEFNLPEATWSALYTGSGAQASGSDKYTQWKQAWQHIVTLYRNSAATNVRFVWNPNNEDGGAQVLESYWPGNTYVDVLGVDCYNFGDAGSWQTFDEIFSDCYARVTALGTTGQPVWIGEMGCREPSVAETDTTGGDSTVIDNLHSKATWVNDMMGKTTYPRLQQLTWFDVVKERWWTMSSSAGSLNAFKTAFAAPVSGSTGSTGPVVTPPPVVPPDDPTPDPVVPDGTAPIVFVSGLNAVQTADIDVPNIYGFHFAQWNVGIGPNHNSSELLPKPQYELVNLKNRSITIRLGEPNSSSFSMSGEIVNDFGTVVPSPQALLIKELETDVWWYRNGQLLERGRIVQAEDTDSAQADVNLDTTDYQGLFANREVHTATATTPNANLTTTFIPSWKPNDVIKWLIDHAENQNGMRLGITYSTEWVDLPTFAQFYEGETIANASIEIADGANILEQINTICNMITPPLEFWIDSQAQAHLALVRGKDQKVILDYQGVIEGFTRSFNSENFGNVVRATGSSNSVSLVAPAFYSAPGANMGIPKNPTHVLSPPHVVATVLTNFPPAPFSADPKGGWQVDRSNDHIYVPPALVAFAKNEWISSSGYNEVNGLYDLDNLYTYSADFGKGQWRGPDHVWVGDYITFVAQRGRININKRMRVVSITISIDDQGIESVSVELNVSRDEEVALKKLRDIIRNLQKK